MTALVWHVAYWGVVALAIAVLIPSVVLLVECGAALLPLPKTQPVQSSPTDAPNVAVLMPAHNEAAVIGQTIQRLLPHLQQPQDLVVVADNCEDATATIARSLGATVLERHDSERRGKGYALDFGLTHLASHPPDVVILMDADCDAQPGTLAQLAEDAIATGRPVQAIYLMEKPPQPQPKDAVSAFAFKVKNLVRPLGLFRVGQPCLLTGTGMAFPWQTIAAVDLASGNIVEDMKLGLDLAIAGHSPRLCPQAHVTGRLPQQQDAATSQRTRWEHGHLQTLLTECPQLLTAALIQRRFDLFTLALDLCVPPLSLLVMLWFGVTALTLVAAALGLGWLPLSLSAIAGVCLFSAILGAWAKFGRSDLPAQTLFSIPLYILWKIPLYFKFLAKPQAQWVRTERDVTADRAKP